MARTWKRFFKMRFWLGHKWSARVLITYGANVRGAWVSMLGAARRLGRSNAVDILQELGATELAQDGQGITTGMSWGRSFRFLLPPYLN